MRRDLPLLVLLIVLLSGCAAATKETSATSPSAPSAPPVEVGADTGSLTGNVTDQELQPLAGVEVALVETAATVKTDAAGQFTFNALAPGDYRLVASRIGFEQVGKKVTVVAGEVATANLVMAAFVIAEEPYHVSIPSVFYITFGWGLFDAFVTWRLSNATCNPCQRMIDFERAPLGTLAEPIWTPSIDTLATNQQLYIWTERNVATTATGSSGENVWSKYVANREQHLYTEAELAKLKEFKDFRINVGGGVTSAMVQQRVEVWMTFGYVEKLPDGFTALPPP